MLWSAYSEGNRDVVVRQLVDHLPTSYAYTVISSWSKGFNPRYFDASCVPHNRYTHIRRIVIGGGADISPCTAIRATRA